LENNRKKYDFDDNLINIHKALSESTFWVNEKSKAYNPEESLKSENVKVQNLKGEHATRKK
jgi:hypothetical protein